MYHRCCEGLRFRKGCISIVPILYLSEMNDNRWVCEDYWWLSHIGSSNSRYRKFTGWCRGCRWAFDFIVGGTICSEDGAIEKESVTSNWFHGQEDEENDSGDGLRFRQHRESVDILVTLSTSQVRGRSSLILLSQASRVLLPSATMLEFPWCRYRKEKNVLRTVGPRTDSVQQKLRAGRNWIFRNTASVQLPTITLDFEMMTTRYVEDYGTPTTDTEYYLLNGNSGMQAIALPRDLLS